MDTLTNAPTKADISAAVHSSSEVMSTHSSKTLEAGRCTPDRLSSGSSTHKVKDLDKDRIEEWVAKTQKQVEMLSMTEEAIEEEDDKKGDGEEEVLHASDEEDGLSERISIDASSDNEECAAEKQDETVDV